MLIKCSICGKEIKAKNGIQKYCIPCRKIKDKELRKEQTIREKKKRNNM